MIWRPWRQREEAAAAAAAEAAEDAQEAAVELGRVQAAWDEVREVANGVRRETVQLNGWTARAKKAMS